MLVSECKWYQNWLSNYYCLVSYLLYVFICNFQFKKIDNLAPVLIRILNFFVESSMLYGNSDDASEFRVLANGGKSWGEVECLLEYDNHLSWNQNIHNRLGLEIRLESKLFIDLYNWYLKNCCDTILHVSRSIWKLSMNVLTKKLSIWLLGWEDRFENYWLFTGLENVN